MNPLTWLGDQLQNLLIVTFNFCGNYPKLTGSIFAWWVFCYVTISIIHGMWPESKTDDSKCPPVARVLLQLCSPFLGIVRAIITFVFEKIGIKLSVSVGNKVETNNAPRV